MRALAEALDGDDGPCRPMADRDDPREVWITGVGVISAIGIGLPAFRAGLRANASPVKRIDRFDPAPVPVEGRRPGRRLRSGSTTWTRGRSAASTGSRSSASRRAAWRWPTPGSCRAWTGRPTASGSGSTSGRRWAASPSPRASTRSTSARGLRAVSPTLALAVFGGAAPANIGIALDVRGPILSTANSCASGAVAIGEAMGAIRTGEIDAAIAGGVECPLSPLAFGAFDLIRALGQRPQRRPGRTPRGRWTPSATASSWARAPALLVLEAAEAARAARRPSRTPRVMGYGATSDAHHMVQPRADGREAARAIRIALDDAARRAADIDWVSAHASSTPIGDIAEARAIAAGLGAGRRHRRRERHQGPDRPPAGRDRRHRGRDGRARLPRRLGARDGEPRGPRAGHRRPPARPPARRPRRRATGASCRPRSASAASTRRWCSGPSTGDDPRVSPARYPRAMTDMPTWERRFRAPILAFPSWAADAPDRLVMASTESGSYQLHTWDRATGERRQVTEDPVGVLEGRPTRDGTGVIWFHDETGAESGSYVDRARSTSGPGRSR